jgi:release factor glutamine methyltransferase
MNLTISQLTSEVKKTLGKHFSSQEIDAQLFLIYEKILHLSRVKVLAYHDTKVSISGYNQIMKIVERLENDEPIQYILGETEFYGLIFTVNSSVLIPRPETEELVQWIIRDSGQKSIQLLDVGTGSGCIAVSLAKNMPQSRVFALDISPDALKTAKENAQLNSVTIHFLEQDILSASILGLPQELDLIVSNPPYIKQSERSLMQPNVLNFEPEVALFVADSDPLLFYRAIVHHGNQLLKQGGHLYFEINEALSKEVTVLLKDNMYSEITVKNDIFGKPRMVKGTKE